MQPPVRRPGYATLMRAEMFTFCKLHMVFPPRLGASFGPCRQRSGRRTDVGPWSLSCQGPRARLERSDRRRRSRAHRTGRSST